MRSLNRKGVNCKPSLEQGDGVQQNVVTPRLMDHLSLFRVASKWNPAMRLHRVKAGMEDRAMQVRRQRTLHAILMHILKLQWVVCL